MSKIELVRAAMVEAMKAKEDVYKRQIRCRLSW